MSARLIIAIDGFSACGKSTLAKDLASKLDILYLDSGALYRAICLFCIEHQIHPEDVQSVINSLEKINLHVELQSNLKVFVNNEDVSESIRKSEVNRWVSEISVIPEVRNKVNLILRQFGKDHSLVMDGRDIGTVVFPLANYKFFVTADLYVRALRRQLEIKEKGRHIELKDVLENLQHRDEIDSNRLDSPLKQAEDSILLDNSKLSREQQLEFVLDRINSTPRY
ncbi:MAG: (d)CMP kinase [Saprospiraceae bacterium]